MCVGVCLSVYVAFFSEIAEHDRMVLGLMRGGGRGGGGVENILL